MMKRSELKGDKGGKGIINERGVYSIKLPTLRGASIEQK
jgi:hypothetical protein